MNFSQLKTFVTVVEAGSFSDAARLLGISQPAVTMQVQSLETDVGATLLDRRYRKVDLTEAGRALLPHARRILIQLESAKEDIVALSGIITGRLTIAASTTPGVYVVPRLLGSFLAAYPEVGVRILVHDTAEVVAMVEANEAQIGVTGGTVRGARVNYQESGSDELVLICPKGHALAGKRNVALADLANETWIMRESGSGTRQVAEKILTEHGLDVGELRVAVELGTGEAIVSAVEGGLGVSMLSRHVAEKAIALGSVAQIDAEGLPVSRPLYLVMPKGTPTRAAVAFNEYLDAALKRD